MLLIKGASLAELVCDLRCTGDFLSVFDIVEVTLLLLHLMKAYRGE